eukprot:5747394-Prymnesium_polylepis.1
MAQPAERTAASGDDSLAGEFRLGPSCVKRPVRTAAAAASAAAASAAAAAAPQPQRAMSEAEVRAAVRAEGLTLVPSDNTTGFKNVSACRGRFRACFNRRAENKTLGIFGTALEAALHVARHLAALPAAKVRAAVKAEGLTLVPSDNETGFKGVSSNGSRFFAFVSSSGGRDSSGGLSIRHSLGSFDTALEAALH